MSMMSDDQCEVVFSYQGIGKDELTLEVGQVVNIIIAGLQRRHLGGSDLQERFHFGTMDTSTTD